MSNYSLPTTHIIMSHGPLGFAFSPQPMTVFLFSPTGVLGVWQEAISPIRYTGHRYTIRCTYGSKVLLLFLSKEE